MTNFLNSIPYEILIFFTVIIIAIIIWGFFKIKKENPNDVCSRVVILPIIPAMIACTLKSYCRQKIVNGSIEPFSNIFFWISYAGVFNTGAFSTSGEVLSHKKKRLRKSSVQSIKQQVMLPRRFTPTPMCSTSELRSPAAI